jgi:hypothetical protein
VEVPVLDGVAFIDPKRSMIDIIQAVGRVIRKAEDKRIGTVVIPVFVDESEDVGHALSSSAFEPVWQVLKALRAHDDSLADELDELRLKLGERSPYGGRIRLPEKIKVDVPTLLLEDEFTRTIPRVSVYTGTIRQGRLAAYERLRQGGKIPGEAGIGRIFPLAAREPSYFFSGLDRCPPGGLAEPARSNERPGRRSEERRSSGSCMP